jgi:hypothetical protein
MKTLAAIELTSLLYSNPRQLYELPKNVELLPLQLSEGPPIIIDFFS